MKVTSGIARLHLNKDYTLDFLISIAENRNLQTALKFEIKDEFELVCNKAGINVTSEETTDMFANSLKLSLKSDKGHWFKVKKYPFLMMEAISILAKLLKPYGFYPLSVLSQVITFTTLGDICKGAELSTIDDRVKGFGYATLKKSNPDKISLYFGTDDNYYVEKIVEELLKAFDTFLLPYKTTISRDTDKEKMIFGKHVTFKLNKLNSKVHYWYSFREWLYHVTQITSKVFESHGYFLKRNTNVASLTNSTVGLWYTQIPSGLRNRSLDMARTILVREKTSHSFSIEYGNEVENKAAIKAFVYKVLTSFSDSSIGIRQKSEKDEFEKEVTIYEFFMLNEFDKLKDVNYLFDHVFVLLIERMKEKGIRLYNCEWSLGVWFIVDKPTDFDTVISHDLINNGQKVGVYTDYLGYDSILVACPDEYTETIIRGALENKQGLFLKPKKTLLFKESKNRFISVGFSSTSSQGLSRWVYIFAVLSLLKQPLAQIGLQMVHEMKAHLESSFNVIFERLGYSEVVKPGLTTDTVPLPGIIVLKFNFETKSKFRVFVGLNDSIADLAIEGIKGSLNELLALQNQGVTYKSKFDNKLPYGNLYEFKTCDMNGKSQNNKSKLSAPSWAHEAERRVEKYLSAKKKAFSRSVFGSNLNSFIVYQGFTTFATVS